MLRIPCGRCNFKMLQPHERVHLVVHRPSDVRGGCLPVARPLERCLTRPLAARYLTASYVSGAEGGRSAGRASRSDPVHPVLLAFADRATAERMCRRVPVPGSQYVCTMPVLSAACFSFSSLRMDMVVVQSQDDATGEWSIFYARRGGSLDPDSFCPSESF
jgi:hypothetical protein